jgi:hypothetical protein
VTDWTKLADRLLAAERRRAELEALLVAAGAPAVLEEMRRVEVELREVTRELRGMA